jgi:hypothetical protein
LFSLFQVTLETFANFNASKNEEILSKKQVISSKKVAILNKKEAILTKKAEVLLKPAPVVSSSDKYSALRDLLGEGENSSTPDKGGLI